jgi:threonyl-tRNA synthetase
MNNSWLITRARSTPTQGSRAGGKIQRAEQMKVHTMFVIGKRDMNADAISVRVHGKGNLGAKPRAEAIAEILEAIRERRS